MKILLLGKNGQVGVELVRSLAPLGELIALDRHSQDHCGDLTDLAGIARTISNIRPDVIVNAAAYTAVDNAETEAELAQHINALAPACIANAAKEINALLVHYSTDYVFAGTGENAWRESDLTLPQNIYGHSKLAGENAIIASGCQYLIFRTSWVYATHGRNFLKTMLALAATKSELQVIDDQYGAPTSAALIADVTAHCIQRFVPGNGGIYHLAAAGCTTWYRYAKFIFSIAHQQGMRFLLSPDSVFPVTSAEFNVAAKRPANSRLDCKKLCHEFSVNLTGWEQGVECAVLEILENKNEKA